MLVRVIFTTLHLGAPDEVGRVEAVWLLSGSGTNGWVGFALSFALHAKAADPLWRFIPPSCSISED